MRRGATRSVSGARRYALAAAGPVLLAVIWGLFGAPTVTYPRLGAARIVFEVLWFGTGAAALWVAVRRRSPSSPAAPSVRR
ncbi:MAG: YrdB family protein [Mycobacteriales bacterium]